MEYSSQPVFPAHGQVSRQTEASSAGAFRPYRYRAILAAVIGGVVLILFPAIADISNFHGDERFYTDAALQMLHTGEGWTPVYPDGQLRLNKPILTYWAAAGSMRLLGRTPWAARLLFLLAGALIIGLTFHLARVVGQDPRTAFLAALIMVSNVEWLTLAIRATPDILLCLFAQVSFIGFARLWFQADSTWLGPVLAYGGMGLAVQTKGLLGLCPLAAMALCGIWRRPASPRLKSFLNWPAIGLGLGLGLFWYAVMLHQHGRVALQDIYADQIGAKVTRDLGFVLGNAAAYLFAGFRHFLPWTLLLLAGAIGFRRELASGWKAHRSDGVFLLSLFVVLAVCFSFGNMRRPRYLAASYPAIAIWLAGTISPVLAHPGVRRWLARAILILSALTGLAGIGFLIAGLGGAGRLLAGGGLLIFCGGAGWISSRASSEMVRWTWVAGVCVAAFALVTTCLHPVLFPSPSCGTAVLLRRMSPPPVRIHTWFIRESSASQLRLLGGGAWDIQPLAEDVESPAFDGAEIVLTTEPHHLDLGHAGYDLLPIADRSPAIPATWRRLAARLFAHPQPPYWLAVKAP